MKTKEITLKKLIRILKKMKREGKKIVFTNGCFDIIHSGHIKVLSQAKSMGDILVVGLNGDRSVKALKGKERPVNPLPDRVIVLSAIEYVDYIVVFNSLTPYNLIKLIMPDVLVKGGDYSKENVVGKEFAKKVVIVKLLKGRSTTAILRKSQLKKV
ncbi:MAG: D-glycero-beta-D-manno-heptose 1-phosphate adenylyltransferase [Elusimicrobiota bacterium]